MKLHVFLPLRPQTILNSRCYLGNFTNFQLESTTWNKIQSNSQKFENVQSFPRWSLTSWTILTILQIPSGKKARSHINEWNLINTEQIYYAFYVHVHVNLGHFNVFNKILNFHTNCVQYYVQFYTQFLHQHCIYKMYNFSC